MIVENAKNLSTAPPTEHPQDRDVRIVLDDVSIHAGGNCLVRDAAAEFPPGEVTLIVGPSGAGKSTLLRVLAGLVDERSKGLEVSGRVLWNGRPESARRRCRATGVVFQDGALLDELSPLDNLRLARAHRSSRGDRAAVPSVRALADELRVPTRVRTALLSGGQRQRLAIARTLAYDPDVILYDEPTSGLDSATAVRVAERLRSTHDTHRKTTIVVTHDYEALAPIADRIYVLDASTQTLEQVPRSEWDRLRERMLQAQLAVADGPSDSRQSSGGWWQAIAGRVSGFFSGTSRVAESVLTSCFWCLPLWRSPWWGVRFLLHYFRLVAGLSAWTYLLLSGIIIGFVATYFTFRFLPYAQYTKPLLIEDLLMSMGFALYRILVPVLATLLIAARCGAAVASDIGGKSYGHQLDALRTMGVSPQRYLLGPILNSFLLGTPLLTGLSYIAARFTSLTVFVATHPHLGADYWDLHFHRMLVVPGQSWYAGTAWVLAKVLTCGFGVGLLAYYRGARPQYSGRDVSDSITSTILWSTLLVLTVHFAFAFFEFD